MFRGNLTCLNHIYCIHRRLFFNFFSAFLGRLSDFFLFSAFQAVIHAFQLHHSFFISLFCSIMTFVYSAPVLTSPFFSFSLKLELINYLHHFILLSFVILDIKMFSYYSPYTFLENFTVVFHSVSV